MIFFNINLGWQVKFDYQETNKVAHALAKLACSIVEERILLEEVPESVEISFVLVDKQ